MDVELLLNYSRENEAIMEKPIDEEITQGEMDTLNDDYHDLDYSCILSVDSPTQAFLTVVTLNHFFLQSEKHIPNMLYALQKIKDEIKFSLGGQENY